MKFLKIEKMNLLLLAPLGLWTSLGFYRGINCYNYVKEKEKKKEKEIEIKCATYRTSFPKDINKYCIEKSVEKSLENKINNYYYTECFCEGVTASMLYVFPLSFPFLLYKEFIRLEIVIRNINDEKTLDYYYSI
jgi:hypothetical protein